MRSWNARRYISMLMSLKELRYRSASVQMAVGSHFSLRNVYRGGSGRRQRVHHRKIAIRPRVLRTSCRRLRQDPGASLLVLARMAATGRS